MELILIIAIGVFLGISLFKRSEVRQGQRLVQAEFDRADANNRHRRIVYALILFFIALAILENLPHG